MSYATQITIFSGQPGKRTGQPIVLGATTAAHREEVREFLPNQPALLEIEHNDGSNYVEMDFDALRSALAGDAVATIMLIDDEGLRDAMLELRGVVGRAPEGSTAFACLTV